MNPIFKIFLCLILPFSLSAQDKRRISKTTDLPNRFYSVSFMSGEKFFSKPHYFGGLARQVSDSLLADLARYDIQDSQTLSDYYFNLACDDLAGANRTEFRQVTVRQIRQEVMDQYNTWMDSQNCEGGLRTPRVDCSFERFISTLSQAQRNNMYETVTITQTVPIINEENDGIAMKYSTNGLEGSNIVKFETDLRPDLGVSHQECMNHEFITDIFDNKIFNDTRSFFHVKKRVP